MHGLVSIQLVLPVLNEERKLAVAVQKLHLFLESQLLGYDWRIIIADNGSTDATSEIGFGLSESYQRVDYFYLTKRGRGRALKRTWLESATEIVAYMDVDLSTDLDALPPAVEAVARQGYDIAVGSRLSEGAAVVGRGLKREIISRCYSFLFRGLFLVKFKDAQCGFKVVSRRVVRSVVPLVQNNGWFFDTELLILAEKNGFLIKEIPVRWTDDADSRVAIVSTAMEDLRGLIRLRLGGLQKASRLLKKRNM